MKTKSEKKLERIKKYQLEGRGIYMLGDFLTGYGWNGGNWTEDA